MRTRDAFIVHTGTERKSPVQVHPRRLSVARRPLATVVRLLDGTNRRSVPVRARPFLSVRGGQGDRSVPRLACYHDDTAGVRL